MIGVVTLACFLGPEVLMTHNHSMQWLSVLTPNLACTISSFYLINKNLGLHHWLPWFPCGFIFRGVTRAWYHVNLLLPLHLFCPALKSSEIEMITMHSLMSLGIPCVKMSTFLPQAPSPLLGWMPTDHLIPALSFSPSGKAHSFFPTSVHM